VALVSDVIIINIKFTSKRQNSFCCVECDVTAHGHAAPIRFWNLITEVLTEEISTITTQQKFSFREYLLTARVVNIWNSCWRQFCKNYFKSRWI